jgi:hypothetical protein
MFLRYPCSICESKLVVGLLYKQRQRWTDVTNEKSFVVLKRVYVSTLHVSESCEDRAHGVSRLYDVSVLQHS